MAELGRIKVFLFLVLELQVTVIAGITSVLKRAGDEVMLSCQNVIDGQHNCNGTTWVFSGSKNKELVALVTYGQIDGDTRTRRSVTPNCSLVIKNITAEDVGNYECQQYKKGSEHLVHTSVTYLSVITMTKHEENQMITLSCSVIKFGSCKHKVEWLFKKQEAKKELTISETHCSASVTFLKPVLDNSSVDKLFHCKVTQSGDKIGQVFSFGHQSPGATAATHKPTTITTNRNPVKNTSGSKNVSSIYEGIPYISVGVGLITVLIVAVVVVRWRSKRNKTQRNQNTDDLDVDDGVSYASIRHPRNKNREVLVHGDPDTVTYSTVRSHSSSAAASDDPNNLYSLLTIE
ncbi:uncharacterized protein LOC124882231 [Girardinichthys multiradiatus]|uniref:uncharacterized protein LOC124882231 n=1 Tax=Girardinichthys multiradiatus TaxID=208333 RepID=UPI001FAC13F5|nr:uncharacterized protein LOC124882231 [Girardinichthys multiradiatus]